MEFDVNSTTAKLMPHVTELAGFGFGGARYFLIEGGDLAPDWVPRDGREAWCEVTIMPDGAVVAFGGEVWPAAWPDVFKIGPRTIYGQRTDVTPLGRQLLGLDAPGPTWTRQQIVDEIAAGRQRRRPR